MSDNFKAHLARLNEATGKKRAAASAELQQRADVATLFLVIARNVIIPVFRRYADLAKGSPICLSVREHGIRVPATPFVILLAGRRQQDLPPPRLNDIHANVWKRDRDIVFFCLEVAENEIVHTMRYARGTGLVETRPALGDITREWLEHQLDPFFARAFPAE